MRLLPSKCLADQLTVAVFKGMIDRFPEQWHPCPRSSQRPVGITESPDSVPPSSGRTWYTGYRPPWAALGLGTFRLDAKLVSLLCFTWCKPLPLSLSPTVQCKVMLARPPWPVWHSGTSAMAASLPLQPGPSSSSSTSPRAQILALAGPRCATAIQSHRTRIIRRRGTGLKQPIREQTFQQRWVSAVMCSGTPGNFLDD